MDRSTLSPEDRAVIDAIAAMGQMIRELKEIPSGHLYAQVMGALTLDQYERIISMLVKAGLVKRAGNHLLQWIGP